MRNLKKLCQKYSEAEIYFHQDLDGITSALLMKKKLEEYGVKTVDAHTIQYGDREWSIPKPKNNRLLVLVDFAHGKTIFDIHTDHHDRQTGTDYTNCTSFKSARCNAETLDNSPIQYFPSLDLKIIQTVDSANFVTHNIKPKQLRNFLINNKLTSCATKNRWLMGLACNKLILTYKNKLNFMKMLVLNSECSLLSIYIRAIKLVKLLDLPSRAKAQLNSNAYRNRMKKYPDLEYDARYKIVTQYGGGFMYQSGSYDRYIVFENHPLSEFLIMIWPMGLVQVACNPFNEQRLKGINLGEITHIILQQHKSILENIHVGILDIKYENEQRILKERNKAKRNGQIDKERIGFHTNDLLAVYQENIKILKNNSFIKFNKDTHQALIEKIRPIMDKKEYQLTNIERKILQNMVISAYDLINNNSGGHASITNLSGFSYMKYNDADVQSYYKVHTYTDVMKIFATDILMLLKQKIKESNKIEPNKIEGYFNYMV